MARSFAPNEAMEVAKWHMGLLSRLKSAAFMSPDAMLKDVRLELDVLSLNGYFERSFRNEAERSMNPLSDDVGLSKLVASIYRYTVSDGGNNRSWGGSRVVVLQVPIA